MDERTDDADFAPFGDKASRDAGRERSPGSHHPGPPRFTTVGEGFLDPLGHETEARDDLAPRNPDPGGDYEWRVTDAPDGSEADPDGGAVVEFVPDVPGEYTLELEAPDGVHELTVRAFPEEDESDPRPRLSLDASVVGDRIALSATATVADDRTVGDPGLEVEFYADDRDAFSGDPEGRLSVADVEEPTRIYAVAVGERHSVPDAIDLVPEEGGVRVEHPWSAPEWLSNAVVYEAFARRFPDQDDPTFRTIADRLDHVADLGANVLWLTPVLDTLRGFDTDPDLGGPHGYHTEDYFATDPELGRVEEFEQLVSAAHDRGIRVVFDLVVNHTAVTHPFHEAAADPDHPDHEEYRDWYRRDEDGGIETYFTWDDIPNLNYGNPAVREYVLEVAEFWAETVDGFRCDVAWGVPNSFWSELYDRVGGESAFLMLDETLPGYDVEMGAGRFHLHHDDALHEALRAAPEEGIEGILEAVEERFRKGSHPDSRFLQYVENHDTERYLGAHDADALRAATAATFTLPGIPMLYYGQETGMDDYRAPMNWGEFDEETVEYCRRLIDLYRSHPALGTDARLERIEFEAESDAALAFARSDPDGGRRLVVLLSFSPGTTAIRLPDIVGRTDLLAGGPAELTVADGTATVLVSDAIVLEADGPAPVGGTDETDADAEDPTA